MSHLAPIPFDKVYFIANSKLTNLNKQKEVLNASELPLDRVQVKYVTVEDLPSPGWWAGSNSDWNLLQAHATICQSAILENASSIFIVDESTAFKPNFINDLPLIMEQVPPDWEQLYFGGEHEFIPENIKGNPAIVTTQSVKGAHCYALNRNGMVKFHSHILDASDFLINGPGWTFDKQIRSGQMQGKWKVYATRYCYAGNFFQPEASCPVVIHWNYLTYWRLRIPFIWAPAALELGEYKNNKYVYLSKDKDQDYRYQMRWDIAALSKDRLIRAMHRSACEAINLEKLPILQHSNISLFTARNSWLPSVYEWNACTVEKIHSLFYQTIYEEAKSMCLDPSFCLKYYAEKV